MKRNLLLVPIAVLSLSVAEMQTSQAGGFDFFNFNSFHSGGPYQGPTYQPNRLPEPDTLSLLGIGSVGIAWSLRKKRR